MKACKRLKIKITGKVQGVWFRKYTLDKALELGIKGYVMNLPDGSVYVEAESDEPAQLEAFIRWLHTGSPLSNVKKVEVLSETNCQGDTGFEILPRATNI